MKPSHGAKILRYFDAIDAVLQRAGFPACSPWWRGQLERFLRSGRRRWVLRVGRRGGKSTTLCRLLVAWALFGEWSVPPGDTAVIAIVSVDRDEAANRLRTIAEILRALGVKHEPRAQELDIPERRMRFAVKTCSTKGTIGFTSIALFGDEMASWESRDTMANPAREVMASLRPSMATQPEGFEIDCSAPWGTDDYHAELFGAGDTDAQVVSHAATWEANPTLSESDTRELEPDERLWSRAYAAIPGASVTSDWFGPALDVCEAGERCTEPILPWVRYIVAIDPAFQRDHFGWAVVSSRSLPPDPRMPERQRRMTRLHAAGAWQTGGVRPLDMAFRLRDEVCSRYGLVGVDEGATARVITDQFEGHSFSDLARQAGIMLQVVPWTAGNSETTKIARYRSVRMAMLEGCVQLPQDQGLVSELRRVSGKLLPSGNESIVLPRDQKGGHMDRVSALALGLSEALLRAPQPELVVAAARDEMAVLREQRRLEVLRKRADEMERNPRAWMSRVGAR